MRRIIGYAAVFIVVFLLSLAVMFPFSEVVDSVMIRVLSQNKIALTYSGIDSGLFGTTIKDVVFNNKGQIIELGDLTLKYSPLSAITQKATAYADTPYGKAVMIHTKGTVNADVTLDAARVARLFQQTAIGEINTKLSYHYLNKNGGLTINSGPFSVQTPMMKVAGDSINGDAAIDNNTVTINNIQTTGQAQLKLNGQMRIDPVNTYRTALNITGEGTLMGLGTKFAIRGTVGAPQFVLQ